MNITFLIGNGFDINLGLKTRYSDFYNYYHENASEDSIILKWMKEDDDKGNWSDLEMALGNKIKTISEKEKETFMDAHTELDTLLLEYLEDEQNKYSVDKVNRDIVQELKKSLVDSQKELTLEEQRSYQSTCAASANEEIKYCFISFNYTNILDQIIELAANSDLDLGSHIAPNGKEMKHTIGEVHHVHGTLMEGVVLGVNDESQIDNDALRKDNLFKNVFIKNRINNQMGQRRTEHAEDIINKSQIICIFGMSIGMTDKRWWEKLISWLRDGNHRKLIVYMREDERVLKRKIPTLFIRKREEIRRDLWEKGRGKNEESLYETVSPRIFVVFNSKIFSFPKVK